LCAVGKAKKRTGVMNSSKVANRHGRCGPLYDHNKNRKKKKKKKNETEKTKRGKETQSLSVVDKGCWV
jgi:hypothetical protein